MKKKLLYIAPHLSTGGLPQYLCKKIELIKDDYNLYVIEWDNHTGGKLVVQRNKIVDLIPNDKFFTLGEKKEEILDIIELINPDYIHLEEMPEYFMNYDIAKEIYKKDRKYKIFETSHDSSFNPDSKRFFPDKMLLVSNYQIDMLKSLDVPKVLVEYPIEYKERPARDEALAALGMDPEYKHVINVGLFTPRKNQAEIFDYARNLSDYKIKFHFIGNQADNFKYYWEPLMKNKPDNCVVWGERSDVHKFYEAADLFLFTSRGFSTDKETSPLVIRESIGYGVPSLIYNLSVYQNMYDKYDNIKYLSSEGDNEKKILSSLGIEEIVEEESFIEYEEISYDDASKKIVIIDIYAVTDDKRELVRKCIRSVKKLGRKIMAVSHCSLPQDIVDSLDYHIFDADNQFNDNQVYSFRDNGFVLINNNITKSHEFPIIRSMRLALTTAKKLGFESFILTEFDHEYSDNGISQILELERRMENEKKNIVLFYPKDAIFGDVIGQYYDTCFFISKVDYFIERFESYFPQTLEEYNAIFASRFPNCLEHFFYELFSDQNPVLIGDYVKSHFYDSKINISSYRDTDINILGDKEGNFYVVISNNNATDYEYEIYQNKKMIDSYIINSDFKLTKLSEFGKVTVNVYKDGLIDETKELEYSSDVLEKYLGEGSVEIRRKKEEIKNNIKMELKDLELTTKVPIEDTYNKDENKIFFKYLENTSQDYLVSVKDIDSKACIFSTVLTKNTAGMQWWMMPLPKIVIDFYNNPRFGGFLIEFRDVNQNLLEARERRIKDIPFKKPVIDISNTEPVFMNYEEFFIDKVYDNLDLDNCKTVLDIGANVGLWTKYILTRNARKVYCFEPNKKALEHLKFGLRNDSNATIVEKAVYKEDATLKFYINDENSLTSSVLPESGHSPSYNVDAISLENAINLTGEDKIDLVKIDIEGAEFDIIENLPQHVFDRIDSFLIEYHDFYFTEGMAKVDALESQLENAGYTIHRSTIPKVKYVFASRIKKNYWVNRNSLLEVNNLHDFSKTFNWDEFNAGNQTGYHHMFNELHFSDDQYTKGCNYERFECRIERGDVVVDVGANIGMFANVAYHKGASEILCFEPSDIAFACLDRNKPFKTKTFKAAVLNYTGLTKISLPSQDDTMGASIKSDSQFSNYVPAVTIDSLFEENIIDRIDFLKIDCEGAEKQVLLGISDQNLSKVKKIALEFHLSHLTEADSQEIIERLTAHGFRSFQLFLGDGSLRIYNFWK